MNRRKTVHIKLYSTFSEMKLSADESNITYTVGVSPTVYVGEPDIRYNSVVFIRDTHQIWSHGELYDFASKAQLGAKVNSVTFGYHANDTDIHVTADEKAEWNSKLGADEEEVIATVLNDLNTRLMTLENKD